MIPKSKAPHLNREQRRHHKRFAMSLLPAGSGMPWLLMGLMLRGGFMAKGYGIKDLSTGRLVGQSPAEVLRQNTKPAGISGVVSRLWGKAKGLFGR